MDKISTLKKINSKLKSENTEINNINLQPSEYVINSILNYSKSLVIANSNAVEKIEMILN